MEQTEIKATNKDIRIGKWFKVVGIPLCIAIGCLLMFGSVDVLGIIAAAAVLLFVACVVVWIISEIAEGFLWLKDNGWFSDKK